MGKTKELLMKFDAKCMKMSDFKFTFFTLGLIMLYHAITIPSEIGIRGVENLPQVSLFEDRDLLPLFISVVIITPYIETIVFHTIPLGIYYKIKEKFDLHMRWDFILAGLLGLIFGLAHAINYPGFTMKGFDFTLIGSLFAYVFFRYKRLGKKTVFGLWIIHALNNLIAISPTILFELL